MATSYDFSKKTIAQFLNDVGSSAFVPGGGAVAGLVLAQAAALSEMVCRLNEARAQKKNPTDKSFTRSIAFFGRARKEFLELMTSDAQGFAIISSFAKEDRGGARYEKALRVAAKAPLDMCNLAVESAQLSQKQIAATSPWLYSDLIESLILFEAGFDSARLNVFANLDLCADKKYVTQIYPELKKHKKTISSLLLSVKRARS